VARRLRNQKIQQVFGQKFEVGSLGFTRVIASQRLVEGLVHLHDGPAYAGVSG
jgi:hypothetical protein